jgi:hypothetical protein
MHKPPLYFASLCLLTILLTAGIIRHDVSEEDYLSLAAEKQFDVVGQVFIDEEATGSCVLIDDRYVLSAAHVFISSDYQVDTIMYNGNPMVTYTPKNQRPVNPAKVSLAFNGKNYGVRRIILHPAYTDPQSEGACDLAILELSELITDILPSKLNRQHDELNANVIGVGFGVSGTADKPESVAPLSKKIGGQNVIDSITGYAYIGNHTLLLADFDHPTDTLCNKMGSAFPRPLEYVCGGGDSGGGLFREIDGQWELVGICSGANTNIETLMITGYYGQTMQWTRISVFDNWISANTR